MLEDEGELFLYLVVSKIVVSAVLIREEGKKHRPIFYTSKMLLNAEIRYNSLEKMVLALVVRRRSSDTILNLIQSQ